jgi:hypothetical protein
VATDDQQVLVVGKEATPATFTVPGNGQIRPKAIFAHYDGTSAAAAFLPAIKVTSDGGELVGIYPTVTTTAAGGSADVSWFPGIGAGGGGSLQAFVGARIEALGSAQTVATDTLTDLVYQTVTFDTDGMANLAGDDRKLTVNTAGLYLVTCQANWAWESGSAGIRQTYITQNGYLSSGGYTESATDSRMAIWAPFSGAHPNNSPHTVTTASGIFSAQAGDFFASGGVQESGANLIVNGPTGNVTGDCFLAAALLGV